MHLELRRIAPIRAANILSLFYAVSMLLFSLPFFIVFSFFGESPAPDAEQSKVAFAAFRWALLAYPVFGLAFGWVGGFVGAHLYNLIAARVGGLRLEYLSQPNPSSAPAA